MRFEGNTGSDTIHVLNYEDYEKELADCGFCEDEWKDEECMTGSLEDLGALTKVLPQGFRIPKGLGMQSKSKVSGRIVLSW